MAIQKIQHQIDYEIEKHRIHVELDAVSDFIIIVDEPPARSPEVLDTIDKDIIILSIESGLSVQEIEQLPSGFSPFTPDHPNLDKTNIFIKDGEVFVVEYNSTNKINANCISITGYQFSSTDSVIVKIDTVNNIIRIGS